MNLREAAEKALEALEITSRFVDVYYPNTPAHGLDWGKRYLPEAEEAINALRAALAEADEPVAWLDKSSGDVLVCPLEASKKKGLIPLYPHPPSREPVAWFESPYGEVRVNPLYKFQFPSSLLWWQIPLYTHPPRREPLTEEQIAAVRRELDFSGVIFMTTSQCKRVVRIVERAHGIGGDE